MDAADVPNTAAHRELVLIAALYVHPGREADFQRYEATAARVMQRYGGRIVRVIRTSDVGRGDAQPFEIHIVTFPGQRELDDYRVDPELARLTELRQTSIARTEIAIGHDVELY